MKTLIVLASLVAASSAEARPSTPALSCANAANLVAAHGAMVLSTGTYTYDRFVAHQGFCERNETTKPAWVPTLDNPQCFIGYTCVGRQGGNR